MANWNPWHGCHKLSPGCQNCYVYRADAKYGRDSSLVRQTKNFSLPVRMGRGGYTIPPGETVWTCFSSDFLVADADAWRPECWRMMKQRSDLYFMFITKRIDRFAQCLPPDWGDGYDNVFISCTCENQQMADYRLPIFRDAPIKTKTIVCEPLLGPIDLTPYLGEWVKQVTVGGESGPEARPCHFEWVLSIREQCLERGIRFHFKQTGARFVKDGRLYRVPRKEQHRQAKKAGINHLPPIDTKGFKTGLE